MRLQNQIAVVTGAGRNIGEDVCKLFVQEGAKVAVVDLDQGRGNRVASEINATKPGSAISVVCDVASAVSVDQMIQTVVKQFGAIDILVNNAAWTDHKTLFDITEEEWDRVMNVCLRSVWYCTRSAAKVMIDQKRKGKIINIASTSGHWGRKEATAYTTAKAGVLNFHPIYCSPISAPRHSRQFRVAESNRFACWSGRSSGKSLREKLSRSPRSADGYRQSRGLSRLR